MKIKVLKIILSILIIFLILITAYEIVINFDGFLDKSNPMTREEVIELLEKGKRYPNYYYSSSESISGIIKLDNNRTEHYIKDGIRKVVNDGKTTEWEDTNKDEIIYINGNKYATITKKLESNNEQNEYSQNQFDYSIIANREQFDFNFKYLGEKQIEGRKYVLVKVWNKDSIEMFSSTKFLIDKQTGLITKRTDYTVFYGLLIDIVTDRNLKIDVVTNNDVERPNLDGYIVYNDKGEVVENETT